MKAFPLVARHAAQGGKARAAVLTADERKAIARTAALARWAAKRSVEQPSDLKDGPLTRPGTRFFAASTMSGWPTALFRGTLKIADAQFPVYVLDNRKRVIAQQEVVRLLTGTAKNDIGGYPRNLQPYISKDRMLDETVRFSVPGTRHERHGYEAMLLLAVCDAYLSARRERKLARQQAATATRAEIIVRACAEVGIIGLIDQATGYQSFRKRQELQLKLQAFIAQDLQQWALMFPQEFWYELARLEGVHYSPRSRPLRWGKYIMAFVYDAIYPDIGNVVRKNPGSGFTRHHEQWLKQFAQQKVHDRLERVIARMQLCDDMNDFRREFARVFEKSATDPRMSLASDTGS